MSLRAIGWGANIRSLAIAVVILGMMLAVPAGASGTSKPAGVGVVDTSQGLWRLVEPLFARLSGATEVPGPGDSDGSGTVRFGSGPAGDDTPILCFDLDIANLDGTVTGAHIHEGKAGVAGPSVLDLDYATNGTNGCVLPTLDVLIKIGQTPSDFYVNVHTTVFPAGAVRGQLDAGSTSFFYGNPGDAPFLGDWNCDGNATPGLHRATDGKVFLRNSNTAGAADIEFVFGNPGDVPLIGDWNGDGCDTVSVYRPSEATVYIINKVGQKGASLGPADFSFGYGNPNERVFSGDWNGNGVDGVGLRRTDTMYLRNSLNSGPADNVFTFGNAGEVPLGGDWNGNGTDGVAVFRFDGQFGSFFFDNDNNGGVADLETGFETSSPVPVAGSFDLP